MRMDTELDGEFLKESRENHHGYTISQYCLPWLQPAQTCQYIKRG